MLIDIAINNDHRNTPDEFSLTIAQNANRNKGGLNMEPGIKEKQTLILKQAAEQADAKLTPEQKTVAAAYLRGMVACQDVMKEKESA